MLRHFTITLSRLILIGALGPGAASTALAAGGQVALRTDNVCSGYYYGLCGTGENRVINEYLANEFLPGSIICGARWGSLNQGTIPPPGIGGCDIRLEDPGNPGYPDLVAGLVASADVASLAPCGRGDHFFTFGEGAGIPVPLAKHYISAIEPVCGTGPGDFCGTRLDMDSYLGFAKYYSGGVFGAVPWNQCVEEIVFSPTPVDLTMRASGSARFPGDVGIPVVYTTRANSGGSVTDDNLTLSLSIDNTTGGSVARTLRICADQSVINPKRGIQDITSYFRPVGGGDPILNPLTLPVGRTVFKLEISTESLKTTAAFIADRRVLNLPLVVLVDDPALDNDPCVLDGILNVDSEAYLLGIRRRAGSADDDTMEAFFTVQMPNQVGDSLNVRFRAIDLPKVAFDVTGFEVVGGEFRSSGLPGLDAIELRTEDPVFSGEADLSWVGLLRSFGTADGVGEAPIGPPPTTKVFDTTDIHVDPTLHPGLANNFFVRALLLPGETNRTTAIAADETPSDTILGDSSYTVSGVHPSIYTDYNLALRLLLDGDRSTLGSAPRQAKVHPHADLREIGKFIAIDRQGNPIE